jgi:hypothetical protein
MEEYIDSQHFTPRLGFWVATTLVIIGSILVVFLAGARPSLEHIFGTYFAFALELAFVSGICVGLLQAFLLPQLSFWTAVRWFSLTVVSVVVGWCIVFAFGVLLGRQSPTSSIDIGGQLALAIVHGFLNGVEIGAVIGLVTGIIQGRVQPSSARQWLVGNLISWSLGIGVPLAVFFGIISQISLF